ncbi:hypothetical protein D3C73_978650 [compost metagenome]
MVGHHPFRLAGTARREGDIGGSIRVDIRQIWPITHERLQRIVGEFRDTNDRGFMLEINRGVPAEQHESRVKGANDLVHSRRGIGRVGHREGQAATQCAKHGVDQPRTTTGDDHHPIGFRSAFFDQRARQMAADGLQLAIAASSGRGNHHRGVRGDLRLLDKIRKYRAFSAVSQAELRVWAKIVHFLLLLRVFHTRSVSRPKTWVYCAECSPSRAGANSWVAAQSRAPNRPVSGACRAINSATQSMNIRSLRLICRFAGKAM